jgi:hypothetical protein
MNHYEQKQERRRERIEARADRLQREGAARFESGMTRLRAIPFGQPILIGHHSEKRDRSYRRKAVAAVDKGIELQRAAAEARARAASVGSGGVSSDDPDAVVKLREQLAKVEALQVKMVGINKALRAGNDQALAALGLTEAQVAKLKQPDCFGGIGFASYQLSNNGANIRRIKARIAVLQRAATREHKEEELEGVRLVENVEANRLQLFFPGKPPAEVRTRLKSCGFRWSPSEGAWQRHLSAAARSSAVYAIRGRYE